MSSTNSVLKLLDDNMVVIDTDTTHYITNKETFEVLCELNERVNSLEKSVNELMGSVNARR